MKLTTISTRVSLDLTQKISESGFHISDALQVGLELFLELSPEEQWNLMLRQQVKKKTARAKAKIVANSCHQWVERKGTYEL